VCHALYDASCFATTSLGHSSRRIAAELHVSIKTVESHRENLKQKLDLKDASALVRYAVQWVTPPRPLGHAGAVADTRVAVLLLSAPSPRRMAAWAVAGARNLPDAQIGFHPIDVRLALRQVTSHKLARTGTGGSGA
jgi:DNA-binding CsgD family transcriptional regulator